MMHVVLVVLVDVKDVKMNVILPVKMAVKQLVTLPQEADVFVELALLDAALNAEDA